MTQPTFNSVAYANHAFANITQADGALDVGSNCSGIVAFARNSSASGDIASITVAGNAMTADTEQDNPSGWGGSWRAFRLVLGSPISGSQNYTVDVDDVLAGNCEVLFLCYSDVTAIGASTFRDQSGSAQSSFSSGSISSDTNSVVAWIFTAYPSGTKGTYSADSPSTKRHEASIYQSQYMVAFDRTGDTSVTLTGTITGGSNHYYWGPVWNITGTGGGGGGSSIGAAAHYFSQQ